MSPRIFSFGDKQGVKKQFGKDRMAKCAVYFVFLFMTCRAAHEQILDVLT